MDGRSDCFSRLHFITGCLLEIPTGQVGDQPAFVLAVRHDAGNLQLKLQVFGVHPETGSIESFVCDQENNSSLAPCNFLKLYTVRNGGELRRFRLRSCTFQLTTSHHHAG